MHEIKINVENDGDFRLLANRGHGLKDLPWSGAGLQATLRRQLVYQAIGQGVAERNPELQYIDVDLIKS